MSSIIFRHYCKLNIYIIVGLAVLIVDEISMCHANLWNQIVIQLEAANMWEHVQLPSPNKYKALYVDFVLKARRPQMFASDLIRLSGIKSFESMRKVEMTVQKRCENDPDHTRRIHQLRTGEIDDRIINSFKPLTREDTQNGWEFVPILVTSNCERVLINRSVFAEHVDKSLTTTLLPQH